MLDLSNSDKFDYRYARPIGSKEWEKIVDDDAPMNDDGTLGQVDMFKLEFSGWTGHVEFKPRAK